MRRMYDVPLALRQGPIHRRTALAAGVSRTVLEGPQFERLHEAVYVHRSHEITWKDRVAAARLALPQGACTTGTTRLRELGLEVGDELPLRFVVQGDLHLCLDDVFLHRTVLMPPNDGSGVTPEAAFLAYCAETRAIDAIKVGSLLLTLELLSHEALDELIRVQPWRRGAKEARWASGFLVAGCRSLPEAELVTLLHFAGLPAPLVNAPVEVAPGVILTPDIWYEAWRRAVEYEGGQHQEDRAQYLADVDRYAAYRRHKIGYVQVTKERLRTPRSAVRAVHRELVSAGYDGPGPDFGPSWDMLFARLSHLVGGRPAA